MIINGKSVKGIYFYTDSVTFEKGDFIVSDEKLYIAKAESTGNNPTEHPELFEIYQGTDMATMEEYLEYAKDQKNNVGIGKKSISIPVLASILNRYFSGFSENGIINNEITPSGDVILRDFFSNNISETNTTNPLDQVLYAQNLNNAIFVVSRDVVSGIMPGSNSVILRQYTYKESSDYNRIQELFDPSDGEIIYRYTTWGEDDESMDPGNTTSWKNVTTSYYILNKVNKIRAYYESQKSPIDASGKLNKIDVSSPSLDIYYSGLNKENNPKNVNLIDLNLKDTDVPACIMLSYDNYRDSINVDLKYPTKEEKGKTTITVNSTIGLEVTITNTSSSQGGDKLTISVNKGNIVGFYYLTYNN